MLDLVTDIAENAVLIGLIGLVIVIYFMYKFLALCKQVDKIADLLARKLYSSTTPAKEIDTTKNTTAPNAIAASQGKKYCKFCNFKYDIKEERCPQCGKA